MIVGKSLRGKVAELKQKKRIEEGRKQGKHVKSKDWYTPTASWYKSFGSRHPASDRKANTWYPDRVIKSSPTS